MSSKARRRGRRPPRFERPSPVQAARQLTAFTYGTVLALAVLVALPTDDVESGEAVILVAGVGFSTFLAHLFSDFVGSQLENSHDGVTNGTGAFPLLRPSLPILSATAVPCVILLAAAGDLLGSTAALRAAELYGIGRIALTGFFVARYQKRPATGATWLAGLVLAGMGVGVVAVKVLLGH